MCKRLETIKKVSFAADTLQKVCEQHIQKAPAGDPVLRIAFPVDFDTPLEMALKLQQMR